MEKSKLIDGMVGLIGQDYKKAIKFLGEPMNVSIGITKDGGVSGDLCYERLTVIVKGGLVESCMFSKD